MPDKRRFQLIFFLTILVQMNCCSPAAQVKTTAGSSPVVLSQVPSTSPTVTLVSLVTPTFPVPESFSTQTPFPTTQTNIVPTVSLLSTEERELRIDQLLKTNGNCKEPCFWGFVTDKTTLDEAKDFLSPMGLELILTPDMVSYYNLRLSYKNYLGIGALFVIKENVITSIRAHINVQDSRYFLRSDLAAYLPETVLATYGIPSDIYLYLIYSYHQGIPPLMDLTLYYDDANIIVDYWNMPVTEEEDNYNFCPGQGLMPQVEIWLGKEPHYPPEHRGITLEIATSLTREQFYQQMTERPETTCLYLEKSAFQKQR